MIQVRLRASYAGASYLSALPCLCIEISSQADLIQTLMRRRRALAAVLDGSPRIGRADALFASGSAHESERPESWFRLWLDTLLTAAGVAQVVPPKLLEQEQEAGGGGAKRVWRVQLSCHCQPAQRSQVLALLQWSVDCWLACVAKRFPSADAEALRKRWARLIRPALKPSLLAMARDVYQRELPCELQLGAGSDMLHVGLGVNAQRISQKATDQTSGWGLQCAKNKLLARQLLADAGLPVAPGARAADLQTALRLADQLGYPVVTKPAGSDQGMGVVTLIADAENLGRAWQESSQHGSEVLIEKHIRGLDYRFLVVHGTLMAALERLPGGVSGDAVQTVEQLVAEENMRRKAGPVTVEGKTQISLVSLELNEEAVAMLANQGLTPASIPAAAERVRLRYSANFSVGGSVRECLAEVHPSTRLMLEKVAALFHLDIVGIDILAESIREPLRSQGGVICEVNGLPGVLPHMLAEPQRRLMAEMVDKLLKPECTVPVVAVHGEGAEALINAIEAAVLPDLPGLTIACRSGARQGGCVLDADDAASLRLQRRLVRDPAATALLLQLDGGDLQSHGLACARPDLLILCEPGSDPLAEPWRSWLCRSARRVLFCDPSGPDPVTSLQQAQRLAREILVAAAG